ncbi:uncharacterized protein LOC119795874 [Cyprinodon tularosa]|uniref:uncharacterized protein LOC119795874 n=1 Tax=Cyprinodon tularosa TaxID=77115 RepID=UPI0018E28121|nr:uncharacterized protein LOC119795874 [Cyprinodon tularosa]
MAQLRWIQGFLLIILQLKVAVDLTSVLKRARDEVTLKCSTVIDGQQKCSSTTWIFTGSGYRASVELVDFGQINNDITKADRLSLTADCSLVIKKVREEDAGRYYCQQWEYRGADRPVHQSAVDLSVLNITADQTSVLKRAGDEVTLKCSTVIDGQQKCNSTTWIFTDSGNRASVELVTLGQINNDITKADRLSLTADCSLVIKKVREEDAGRYYCEQWKFRGAHEPVNESAVDLSVLNIIKQENQRVTLSCSVVTFDLCRYKVKWFNQDVDNKEPPSETGCSATVSLSSGFEFPQCKVTDTVTDEEFTFSLQSSEKSGGKVQPTNKPGNKSSKTTRPETENISPTFQEISGGNVQPTNKPGNTNSKTTRPETENISPTFQEISGGKVQPTNKPGNKNSKTTRPETKNISPTFQATPGNKDPKQTVGSRRTSVTSNQGGKVQTAKKPGSKQFTTTQPGTVNTPPTLQQSLWRIIIVSVGLAALSITVVSFSVWTRTNHRDQG